LVRLRLPGPLNRWSVGAFARYYGINVAEAEFPLDRYRDIQSFFTRRLKAGARPLEGPLVHPVDGKITCFGKITDGSLVQAKGVTYGLSELLGEDDARFAGGTYAVYYICPTDYHRVHSPCEFEVARARFIPGDLWPVNGESVRRVPGLFCRNERVAIFGNGGRAALVMVGATNVGRMSLSFTSDVSNRGGEVREVVLTPPVRLHAGDELGVFNMGSTVILVMDSSYSLGGLKAGAVKLGQALG
jgi:phosphatidylserine decarboxylase